MNVINTPSAMAGALDTYRDPWLLRHLSRYRDRLLDAGCEVGDLGPIIVVEPCDTLDAIEQAAGVSLIAEPEYCEVCHGWAELAFVTSDEGSGPVLLVPDCDGIDLALQAIVRAHGADASTLRHCGDHLKGQRKEPR